MNDVFNWFKFYMWDEKKTIYMGSRWRFLLWVLASPFVFVIALTLLFFVYMPCIVIKNMALSVKETFEDEDFTVGQGIAVLLAPFIFIWRVITYKKVVVTKKEMEEASNGRGQYSCKKLSEFEEKYGKGN